ncbi:hypothetical protein FWF48_02390 [Candidatus Saccharibacteria bacterium]|nr:hypothetical protein [Candidatus Saccharibacteria bacterium]
MKIPLRYQITEYDCGQASVLNALSHVFEREEIPADLLRIFFRQTLDKIGHDGRVGDGGTSSAAINDLKKFINSYAIVNRFAIHAEHVRGVAVTEKLLRENANENSAVVISCLECWQSPSSHYVLITKIVGNDVYIFDPYYIEKHQYAKDEAIEIITDTPKTHNRIVKIDRIMNSEGNMSMGEINQREVLIISKA